MNESTQIVNELKEMLGKDEARQTLVYLPVEKLFPHPDNPRKDLGDLTELAESIAKNGVMQNLTVVPNLDDTNEYNRMLDGKNDGPVEYSEAYRDHAIRHCFKKDYTIIIGHRRHGAAILAGEKYVPCIIADLDYPTQIATMLMENLQRADLTVYEQAQSFKQLTISCGMSAASIAKKTGFSETTVRRRLKLSELNQDILKAVSGRQISFGDLEKVTEITDLKARDEVLKTIGTNNFENKLARAKDEQETAMHTARWKAYFKEKGFIEIPSKDHYSSKYSYFWSFGKSADTKNVEDKIQPGVQYYYYLSFGAPTIKTLADKKSTKRTKEEIEKEKRANACKALADAFKRAYRLRRTYILSLSEDFCKNNLAEILRFGTEMNKKGKYFDYKTLCEMAGFPPVENEAPLSWDVIGDQLTARPHKGILLYVYASVNDQESTGCYQKSTWYDTYGEYCTDGYDYTTIKTLYDCLERLGYEPSDEEKALLDGSSELYYKKKTTRRKKEDTDND